jgi:hypothetical protein
VTSLDGNRWTGVMTRAWFTVEVVACSIAMVLWPAFFR